MSKVKFPAREEADSMTDWMNVLSGLSFGGAAKAFKVFKKADAIRIKHHEKVFGDDSPWCLKRNIDSGQYFFEWDMAKAERLGIE